MEIDKRRKILRFLDDLEDVRCELMRFTNWLLEKLCGKINRWLWNYIDEKLVEIYNTLTRILNGLEREVGGGSEA